MRFWQPIHYQRWRDLGVTLRATLAAAPPRPEAIVSAPKPTPSTVALESPVAPSPSAAQPPTVVPDARRHDEGLVPALPRSAPNQTALDSASPPPPSADLSSATRYFAQLAWDGKTSVAAPHGRVHVSPAPVSRSTNESPTSAHAILAGLPWESPAAEVDFGPALSRLSVAAAGEDQGMDPRSAALPGSNLLLAGLRSAARTSDRHALPSSNARTYLAGLAWS